MIGNAVALASRQARAMLADVMARHWGVDSKTIRSAVGEIWAEGTNHKMPMGEAVHIAKNRGVVPVGSAGSLDVLAPIQSAHFHNPLGDE